MAVVASRLCGKQGRTCSLKVASAFMGYRCWFARARFVGRLYQVTGPMREPVAGNGGGGGSRTPWGGWWCWPWGAHGPLAGGG